MDETASEDELGHKQEGDESQDYFVWSGTGTDTETDEECDWQPPQDDPEGRITEDDEMEEDLSDETVERDIRCGLFYNNCSFCYLCFQEMHSCELFYFNIELLQSMCLTVTGELPT